MKFRITKRADDEILRICDFIARDNVDAALRFGEELHRTIKLLAEYPGMGHTREDVNDDRFRFIAVGNYVIAYRRLKKSIVISRVLHGARNFRTIFKKR